MRAEGTSGKAGPRVGALDDRLVKAMTHPLRMKILTRLHGKVASPRQVAAELDERLGTIAYHFRYLNDLELIELVRTEPRRGATEHFYRGLERPYLSDDMWAQVAPAARASVSAVVVNDIVEDVKRSIHEGRFDAREDRHLSRVPLVIDEQGWQDVRDLLAGALEDILLIQGEAANRMATKPGTGPVHAEAAMLLFEAKPRQRRRTQRPKPTA